MIETLETTRPAPDPRLGPPESERIMDELGDRIALLAAQINAATYQLLVMIREFDEGHGWNAGICRSCAHWLTWRTGMRAGTAREKVRVARALADLPLISDAMRRGVVSYSKVRAITRIGNAENEQDLLDFARAGTAAHVERLVRGWRRCERNAAADREEKRRDHRYLDCWTDEDGMVVVRGRLEPEAGAALMRALDAARDELYARADDEKRPLGDDKSDFRQGRADAMGLVAEAALSGGGLDPGTRGDRYQVVVHVDAAVLVDAEAPGACALEDGQDVSAETSRRLLCDCSKVAMLHDPEGRILDVGRRTRTISPALRRALNHRDRNCRFPGCGCRICDAHHIEHWVDGGETSLSNTFLICRRHHALLHERGFTVERRPDGELRFYRPDGSEVRDSPVSPWLREDAVEAIRERLDEDGVAIDEWTSCPLWEGERIEWSQVFLLMLN